MTLEELKQKVRQAYKRVIILRGISGSGKSTLAKEISQCRDSLDIKCLSADQFFQNGEQYEFDPRKLGYAHAACFYAFIREMEVRERQVIIIDNTNVRAIEIAPYVQAAVAFGYAPIIVNVPCDPVLAASRNVHGVPEDVIQKAYDRLTAEDLPEWWEIVDFSVEEIAHE